MHANDLIIDEKLSATSEHVTTVYNPTETIDPAVSRKVARQFDLRLVPILALIYLFAYVDRSNSGNARVLGMGAELELTKYRFNVGLSCFYVTYIIFEIPANLMCKKFGAKTWLPLLTLCFGLITTCSAFIQNYGGFIAVRLALGAVEAGIMPGITYTLSCYYTRHEIVSRIGVYSGVTALTKIPQWGMMHTWRNIYFFEGILSLILAVCAYFTLPDSPETAKYLSTEERHVAALRIRHDLKTSRVETISRRYVKRALLNVNTILLTLMVLCSLLTVGSMSLFIPSILVALGYSGIQAQLLSVPIFAWGTIVMVTVAIASDLTKRRGVLLLSVLPFTALGFILLISVETIGVRYFALFFCLMGSFTAGGLSGGWAMDNTAGHTTRAIVAATIAGFGNIGGLIAAWTYTLNDAPRYIKGHSMNLGACCAAMVLVCLIMLNLWRENKAKASGKRDYRLTGLTEDEIADLGHLHPEYKFTL